MKKVLVSLITVFFFLSSKCQSVGIGTTSPNGNAILDLVDSTKGLLIPRIDSTHRLAIPNTKGLIVYDTTTQGFWYNDGNTWLPFATVPFVEKKVLNALTQTYLTRGF